MSSIREAICALILAILTLSNPVMATEKSNAEDELLCPKESYASIRAKYEVAPTPPAKQLIDRQAFWYHLEKIA
ncbi:hypothetical protein [Pseudomonas moraviensis]